MTELVSPEDIHNDLLGYICTEFLAPQYCRQNFERFKTKCYKYLGTPANTAIENPREIMEVMERKGNIGVGHYDELKAVMRHVDLRAVKMIEEKERRIWEGIY